MKSFVVTVCCLLLVKLSICQEALLPIFDDEIIYEETCSINETTPIGCQSSSCQATCQNRSPGPWCTDDCTPCVCKPNYIKDEVSGKCVELKDCPPKPPCPENSIVIDPCAAEECLRIYPLPVEYAQADVAQEAASKQSVQNNLSIIRPLCSCIPECQCLPNYVMYNQKCVPRKIKPTTRRPIFETIGPIYTRGPEVYEAELQPQVAYKSRQHHQRKQHHGLGKKRHHSEEHKHKKNKHH